jgi:hypothetical protein
LDKRLRRFLWALKAKIAGNTEVAAASGHIGTLQLRVAPITRLFLSGRMSGSFRYPNPKTLLHREFHETLNPCGSQWILNCSRNFGDKLPEEQSVRSNSKMP